MIYEEYKIKWKSKDIDKCPEVKKNGIGHDWVFHTVFKYRNKLRHGSAYSGAIGRSLHFYFKSKDYGESIYYKTHK